MLSTFEFQEPKVALRRYSHEGVFTCLTIRAKKKIWRPEYNRPVAHPAAKLESPDLP